MAYRKRHRGTTYQRGYNRQHTQLRAWWKPQVEAGGVLCHALICMYQSREIPPWAEWHLGHTADRTGWTGPEHARCNEADGARRTNRQRAMVTVTSGWTQASRW